MHVLGQRLWQPTHTRGTQESFRKGVKSTAIGHSRLPVRTRGKRTLDASRIQKWTSRIRTSDVPGGHPRHDSRGRRKRRYQEGTREQYRGKPDGRKDCTLGERCDYPLCGHALSDPTHAGSQAPSTGRCTSLSHD